MNEATFAAQLKEIEVKTLSYKTVSVRKEDVQRKWHLVDATNLVVGRMSSEIATILRGKHKAYYTPHVDCGDYVVVVNAEKVRFTGNKMEDKVYQRYSGYTGGQKERTAKQQMQKQPEKIIELAVKRMLPKSKLGDQMYRKLFVYSGPDHQHEAQKPEPLKLNY